MICEHCGSGRHESENCHVLNLTRFIFDESHDEGNLPDFVGVMDAEELLSKTESELHDEVKQINKLRK